MTTETPTQQETAPPPPETEPPAAEAPAAPAPPSTGWPVRQLIGTTLLIVSATLFGFTLYIGLVSQLHYDRVQHDAYADFRTQLAQATAPVGPTQPTDPKALVTPGTSVAVLEIPALGLRNVVFEGTSGAVLQGGPGHLRDTPLPGQAGTSEIMGRAVTYGGPFGRLDQLSPGDRITVTTGLGASTFRIIDLRRAGDREPPPVTAGHGRLILATADGIPFWPSGVLHVDADLVTPAQPTSSPVLSAATLPPAEQAMAIDPSAWFPLVLWGQALLLGAAAITWARTRWGRWQVWIVAVPVLGFLGLSVADQASRLLLNLM
jgi:LPXTG-site transpeptidase (sortase) family protein